MGENLRHGIARPYANPADAIKAIGRVAASDVVRVRGEDGREFVIPPQPSRPDEEDLLRHENGEQSLHSYGIFDED